MTRVSTMGNATAVERYGLVISGASYAGLALAAGLSQALGAAFRIAVVDRGADILAPAAAAPDARAFALSAGSRHMLDVLGVWAAVAAEAQPVARIEITDSSLSDAFRPVLLAYDNTLAGGEPASWIVPARALLEALKARVATLGAVTALAADEITAMTADSTGAVLALKSGRTLAAPLAVAAEGRRSALRDLAGIKVVGWGYGQRGIVVTVAHESPHEATAVQHFLPAGPFAILPLTANRSCITWSEEEGEARRILALGETEFLGEVEKRFGGRLGALSIAGPRQSWPLEMHLARAYAGPRLALVGDTAHGVHPIAGQGLNLALRDVAALVEVVADAARLGLDIGAAGVVERYQRWRRFDGLSSAAAFDALNRLFSTDWMAVRALRSTGLGVVNRLPALKSLFVQEAAGLTGDVPRLLRGEAA